MKPEISNNARIFATAHRLAFQASVFLLESAATIDNLNKATAIPQPAGAEQLHGTALALTTKVARMFRECYDAQVVKDQKDADRIDLYEPGDEDRNPDSFNNTGSA